MKTLTLTLCAAMLAAGSWAGIPSRFDPLGRLGMEDTTAWYEVTTTAPNQTNTITLAFSAPTVVTWGDGLQDNFTGSGVRTHGYAAAGTYKVSILTPGNVTTFNNADNKVTIHSRNIKRMTAVTDFRLTAAKAGTFNSTDVTAWRPLNFYLYSMPSGYAGTFNSADVTAWRPTTFHLSSMPSGYAGTFNSADVTAWRPSSFNIYAMPSGYAGTFNSADVTAWRPTQFYLFAMPSGYAGTFNSADVTAWRPLYFSLQSMPSSYAGTFNSADVTAWRPLYFYLLSMPSGYAGTFNSADVTAWRPTTFDLDSMPTNMTHVVSANSYTNFITCNNFRMQGNSLTTNQVNSILSDLYIASLTRTATAGTINVGGNNQAPSGILQACASPPVTPTTPGKEIAYELKNDSLDVIANHWSTVTITN